MALEWRADDNRAEQAIQSLTGLLEEGRVFEKEDLLALAEQRMPFGRYAGHRLIDLPEEYLLWFRGRGFPAGKLGELMALALEIRIEGLEYLIEPLKGRDSRETFH